MSQTPPKPLHEEIEMPAGTQGLGDIIDDISFDDAVVLSHVSAASSPDQPDQQVPEKPLQIVKTPIYEVASDSSQEEQTVPEPVMQEHFDAQSPAAQHGKKNFFDAIIDFVRTSQLTSDEKKQELAALRQHRDEERAKEAELIHAEKLFEEGIVSIRDLIAPSAMEIEYNHLKVSGLYAQTFFVYAYPRYLDVGWMSPLINSDMTMDISIYVYPVDMHDILKQMRIKVAQLTSSIAIERQAGKVRDVEVENAVRDIENLRDSLSRGEEKFFQMGVYFTLFHEDRTELDRLGKQIEVALA